MSLKKQNILFVIHKANRTGAPILLLEIIKAFKQQSQIPFQILIMNNGELANEFSLLGKTYIWFKKPIKMIPGKRSQSFAERMKIIARGFYILYQLKKTSLVFFNTIDNGHIHKKLLFLKCRYIYYVHELEAAIQMLTNKETLKVILNNTNLFLTVSEAVKNNLITKHSVNKNIIRVITTPIKNNEHSKTKHKEFIADFKRVHVIPDDAIVVGAIGQNEWRKGFDLFFPLIKIYFHLFPDSKVFFIWKGFNESNLSSFFDLYNEGKFLLNNKAAILPHGKDNIETMACLNIHLLLSREDPYPLVTLEAASFGIPTICFTDGGGSPEFVEDDAGTCVPYSDLFQMAQKINLLAADNILRNKLGETARQKVKRHSFEKTIPDMINILENFDKD